MANSKPRIWELDALRGVCILCVIVVHFLFDLSFFGGLDLTLPAWYIFIQEYGGAIFVVLSGVCVTLGSKSVRRGLIVFACGMLITAVTYGMYRLGMSGADVVVKFGVLHLLGVCMLVYPAFKKLPPATLTGHHRPAALALPAGAHLRGLHIERLLPSLPAAGLLFNWRCHRQNGLPRKADASSRLVSENRHCPLFLLVRAAVTVHLSAASADRLRPS